MSRLVAMLAGVLFCDKDVRAAQPPNILPILVDDLGNADLGDRGSPIETPYIDAPARWGARLESYYGLPLCTPARAVLMTGRYPLRHGLQSVVIFPGHRYGLSVEERTLPARPGGSVGALRQGGAKPSEWIEAQSAFLAPQGKTAFHPGFDIDDGGLPTEKPVLPAE